jgi:hypothetical protein
MFRSIELCWLSDWSWPRTILGLRIPEIPNTMFLIDVSNSWVVCYILWNPTMLWCSIFMFVFQSPKSAGFYENIIIVHKKLDVLGVLFVCINSSCCSLSVWRYLERTWLHKCNWIQLNMCLTTDCIMIVIIDSNCLMMQQPPVFQGLLIPKVSRSH